MQISSTTLELAFSRILVEMKLKPGQPFDFASVRDQWQATGLRASDLRDVVHELMEKGLLRVANSERTLRFELTDLGARRLCSEYGMDANPAVLATETEKLQTMQERAAHPEPGRQPRRRQDAWSHAPMRH